MTNHTTPTVTTTVTLREIGVVLDPHEAAKVRHTSAALTSTLLQLQARRETFYLQVRADDEVIWDWTRGADKNDELWMLQEGQPLALTSASPTIRVVDDDEDTFTIDLADLGTVEVVA
jgi:chloramphenicol O-acetyltransferase